MKIDNKYYIHEKNLLRENLEEKLDAIYTELEENGLINSGLAIKRVSNELKSYLRLLGLKLIRFYGIVQIKDVRLENEIETEIQFFIKKSPSAVVQKEFYTSLPNYRIDILKYWKIEAERAKVKTKNKSKNTIIKNISRSILIFVIFLLCIFIYYFVRTGEIIKFTESGRNNDYARSYFNNDAEIVMRDFTLGNTQKKLYIIFEKDAVINTLFGELYTDTEFPDFDSPYDNKVVIVEQNDIGILNPLLSIVFPFQKKMEVSLDPNQVSDIRLFDVRINDLNSDGDDEIFIQWIKNLGGSLGVWYPALIKYDNGDFKMYNSFPGVETTSNKDNLSDNISYVETIVNKKSYWSNNFTENVEISVNDKLSTTQFGLLTTDDYFIFDDIDSDGIKEFIIAYPMGDWECHYCDQSWYLSIFEFLGSGFVGDLNYEPSLINKDQGIGLLEMHGYSFIPLFGQFHYLIKPTWLNSGSQTKARSTSVIFDYINN